jgi:ABC-type multidrug transport system ATPase subunit
MVKMVGPYNLQGFQNRIINRSQTYNFYIFGSLAANEFIGPYGEYFGQFYDCPYSGNATDPACQQYRGRYIMDSLGFPTDWIWRPIVVSASFIITFFLGAWLILTFWKVDIDVAQARKNDEETPSRKEAEISRSSQEVRHVTIGLDGYGLEVRKRHLLKRTYSKTILNSITTVFEPAKINVIMGPSGCGKTSLLQSIAGRLNNTYFSKYSSSGMVLLNGAIPTTSVIKSVASFVMQDDDALMPSLTVRETLRFAAGLRLPPWMSRQEKLERAEQVMVKLGLKDCADNLIGSELRKGISGGEKRRVSIAIQVLTDPKVLLLDEPTSGLDAHTATSIIDVLRTLAEDGRTVIMTIHQSRSDVFQSFDNVLLLARGGSAVYSGEGEKMLQHFKKLGFECPRTTNPADFVLDLITVDLHREDKEAATRERVQQITQKWEAIRKPLGRRASKIASSAELNTLKRETNPFRITFPQVLRRSALNIRRSPEILVARIMQVLGMDIIFCLFFAPLQSNQEAVQSRMVRVAALSDST